ncbi:MAG: hypothetical protein M3065_12045, partial [Actinomycetota bacterium]|nr:hypothetical protein [Actinomycetota bacterium]
MRRIRPLRTGVLAAALALCGQAIVPTGAAAHGLGGAAGLPIPTWLFAWGASIALVASFVGLATLWPESRLARRREHIVARVPALLDPLCGAVGVALFALVVYAGVGYPLSRSQNGMTPSGLTVSLQVFGAVRTACWSRRWNS